MLSALVCVPQGEEVGKMWVEVGLYIFALTGVNQPTQSQHIGVLSAGLSGRPVGVVLLRVF